MSNLPIQEKRISPWMIDAIKRRREEEERRKEQARRLPLRRPLPPEFYEDPETFEDEPERGHEIIDYSLKEEALRGLIRSILRSM